MTITQTIHKLPVATAATTIFSVDITDFVPDGDEIKNLEKLKDGTVPVRKRQWYQLVDGTNPEYPLSLRVEIITFTNGSLIPARHVSLQLTGTLRETDDVLLTEKLGAVSTTLSWDIPEGIAVQDVELEQFIQTLFSCTYTGLETGYPNNDVYKRLLQGMVNIY